MEKVTLDKLNEIASKTSVYDALQWAVSQYGESPKRPKKPELKKYATSSEVKEYALKLEEWENDCSLYLSGREEYMLNAKNIEDTMFDFIKDASGLNDIPVQYRSKVYSLAHSYGHSDGFYSVYQSLVDLVDIFK